MDDPELAHDIDIIKFAAARKKEIDLLQNEAFLGKENKHKSLFQLLPRHMRRRTMGYLRKRLPHRIRSAAIIKPPAKANKRPSRKHRRRVTNLVKEYERRKKALADKMWLETHIWHAKRFHMSESLYGYRLPVHDNCKCKRAVFKCLKKYCCIHVSLKIVYKMSAK
jgi:ribonuclease P/MRP protein subunit POP1